MGPVEGQAQTSLKGQARRWLPVPKHIPHVLRMSSPRCPVPPVNTLSNVNLRIRANVVRGLAERALHFDGAACGSPEAGNTLRARTRMACAAARGGGDLSVPRKQWYLFAAPCAQLALFVLLACAELCPAVLTCVACGPW